MSNLLAGTTEEQRAAILHANGPAIVSAAPGSGKTMTITRRIAWLIQNGTDPTKIVGITFTNKAAKEMKDRVISLVGKKGKDITLSTFHSYCCRLLRKYHKFFGLSKNFTIADESDSDTIFIHAVAIVEGTTDKDIKKSDLNLDILKAEISKAKNRLLLPDEIKDHEEYSEKAYLYYREYQRLLGANNMVDFDDMIMLFTLRIRNDKRMQNSFAKAIHYLLVDEFQDTNHAQFELIYWLSHIRRNIFVVGDLDQSIYGWRGAESRENEDNFFTSFPEAKIYLLQTNFRSTPPIVEAANAVIQHNARRIEKTSKANKTGGKKPIIYECETQRDEANLVITDICAAVRNGKKWRDHAILFRTRNQHRWLEEACIKRNVPYIIIGAKGFFHRAVVKDILAYLSLSINPRDDISFTRIYNKPRRGFGAASFAKFSKVANDKNIPLLYMFRHMDICEDILSSNAFNAVKYMKVLFTKLIKADKRKVGDIVEMIVKLTDMEASFDKNKPDVKNRQLDDMHEMIQAAHDYDKEIGRGVLGFLEYASMMQTRPKGEDEHNKVMMMTVHAAKGLEFDSVYLVGAVEGIMPILRGTDMMAPENITSLLEEERRVFFVAITRAETNLTITYPRIRLVGKNTLSCEPSRYLLEMGDTVRWNKMR